MKAFLAGSAIALGLCGCTSYQLKSNTVSASATLNTIFEEQVLENLGRFKESNGNAIPSGAYPHQGSITVQNQISPTFKLPFMSPNPVAREVDVGLQRQWNEQWTTIPVVDALDLYCLQWIFKAAVICADNRTDEPTANCKAAATRTSSGLTRKCPCKFPSSTAPGNPTKGLFSRSPSRDTDQCETGSGSEVDGDSAGGYATWVLKSHTWLRIDAPHPDGFKRKGIYSNHEIWVEEGGFSEFVIFTLSGTPRTQTKASSPLLLQSPLLQ